MDTIERIRQFTANGDTSEGRIIAQLALSEIERLHNLLVSIEAMAPKDEPQYERSSNSGDDIDYGISVGLYSVAKEIRDRKHKAT